MNWDEMAVVGRIARAHGVKGQVIINPETDFPEDRFQRGAEVFANQGGDVRALIVTTARLQNGRPVVGFEGIGDMNAATALSGSELRVPVERLLPLPVGAFYRHDLIGCAIETQSGERVGLVTGVEGTLTGSRLVVDSAHGELLVPLAEAICIVIDPAARRIVIDPPDGRLVLNARPG